MPNKLLIVLFAGPESACKLQHAVLFARDVVARGGEATVILEGASPAWLPGFVDKSDKLTSFFAKAMEENLIAGVCRACAGAADAISAATELGLPLLSGAFGHASMDSYISDDYTIMAL